MASFNLYEEIDVSFTGHHYFITVCNNGLNDTFLLQSMVKGSQVLIVTNQTIAPLYLQYIQDAFAKIQCDILLLPDGEEGKNQENLFKIYDLLIEKKHHRDTTLIALGGGVIGDITGFAASTYQRGVPFIQIPTTLLAQVDASVGGKTAINHPQGKNMIGSFYQPQAVLVDVATLNTLPLRAFRSGLAEMIKYALLAGGAFLERLAKSLEQGITANSSELPFLIAQCCRIKAEYVAEDEKEQGRRALLNLGHTFAHALETYTHYQHYTHGEAVAIGLYCAALLSYEIGLIEEHLLYQVEHLLERAGLPHKIPKTIDLNKLCDLMRLDKKIKNNALRFVLIKKAGDCYLEDQVTEPSLFNALNAAVSP